jgi:hypothetical protein
MQRHRQDGRTSIVSLLALVAIGGALWYFVPRFLAERQYVEDLNHCRQQFSAENWQASVEAYQKLWADYPGKSPADRTNVGRAYANWGNETYRQAIARKAEFATASKLYRQAVEYVRLQELELFNFADSCIESGDLKQAAAILQEARNRDDVNAARFTALEKRLARARGATPR